MSARTTIKCDICGKEETYADADFTHSFDFARVTTLHKNITTDHWACADPSPSEGNCLVRLYIKLANEEQRARR